MTEELKRCTKCGKEKTLDQYYYKDEDSLRSECITCLRDKSKTRGEKLREKNQRLYAEGKIHPIEEKWCKVCDEVKHWEEFYFNFQSSTLLSSYCKECHKKDTAQRKRLKKYRPDLDSYHQIQTND